MVECGRTVYKKSQYSRRYLSEPPPGCYSLKYINSHLIQLKNFSDTACRMGHPFGTCFVGKQDVSVVRDIYMLHNVRPGRRRMLRILFITSLYRDSIRSSKFIELPVANRTNM